MVADLDSQTPIVGGQAAESGQDPGKAGEADRGDMLEGRL